MRLSMPIDEVMPLRQLAMSIGVAVDPQEEASGKVLLHEYFRWMQEVSLKLRDETASQSLRPLMAGSNDFVLDHMLSAPNLEGGMREVARAYNMLHGGDYNRVERRRDRLAFVIDNRNFPHVYDRDAAPTLAGMEAVLVFLHAMLSAGAGVDLTESLRIVSTRRRERDPANGLLAFWTVPVRYGCPAYTLEYDVSVAARPVCKDASRARSANSFENAFAMVAARERLPLPLGFPTRVRNVIASGVHDQGDVARLLNVSVPTLRRRLADSELSFRDLRVSVLNENARALLAQGQSSADIAQALGFTDARSFSRAFKEWNGGMTPAAFAAAARQV